MPLIRFQCEDKVQDECWSPGRALDNIIHPFRVLNVGSCNSGKTSVCKHILLSQDPPFKKIWVITPSKNTNEWTDVVQNDELLNELPNLDLLCDNPTKEKRCLIVDDMDIGQMTRTEKSRYQTLLCHVSSHNSLSVIISIQNLTQLPPAHRRSCSFMNIWRFIDMEAQAVLMRRMGLNLKTGRRIWKDILTNDPHQFLSIDLTKSTPARYRANLLVPINIEIIE